MVRFGLITDVHYADRPAEGGRFHRESLEKLDRFSAWLRPQQPEFLVALGDLIDSAPTVEEEAWYLRQVQGRLEGMAAERHYVLGNHCLWSLTRREHREITGSGSPFYSFDRGGFHFVVLDACYRADGVPFGRQNNEWFDSEIPPVEREWLAADLVRAAGPVVVFVHQRLDVEGNYGVRSGAAVRAILEESGNVWCVFQGHEHEGGYSCIRGIYYITLLSVIEGSGPENDAGAVAELLPEGRIEIRGFGKQPGLRLRAGSG